MTLALLPQPGAREGRDRLEILSALISAPSFDPLFRPDIVKIPAGHPVYRWNCLAGCERAVTGHGDLCGAHQGLWLRQRAEGGTRAGFLQTAGLFRPNEGIEERTCRICPDRPACQMTLRLCHYHQFRWYNYRAQHGGDAVFSRWLACQEASAGYGRCLVLVCPEKAFSPLGLCSRHDARYQRDGRPGGAALPSQWGSRYERTGQAVPGEYAGEPAFRRWCSDAAAVPRPDRVNLRGLHPLLRAEIQWGMCWHARRQHGKWELALIQRVADYGRARGLRSLTDMDADDPGLRKAVSRDGARIAVSIAVGLRPPLRHARGDPRGRLHPRRALRAEAQRPSRPHRPGPDLPAVAARPALGPLRRRPAVPVLSALGQHLRPHAARRAGAERLPGARRPRRRPRPQGPHGRAHAQVRRRPAAA